MATLYEPSVPVLPDWVDINLLYYLSGPMTGYPNYNYDHFEACATQLRDAKLKLISPHEMFHEKVGEAGAYPWEYYMRKNLRFLMKCGGIIMLKDWPSSKGAFAEFNMALVLGLPILYYDNYMLISMRG